MPGELGAVGTAVVETGAGAGGSDAGTGAGTGGGGTGDGAGAGDGAGGDAGDAGEGDAGAGEGGDGSGEGDGDAAAAGEGDGTGDGEGDSELDDLQRDGRKIDQKTRTALAELKKLNPEAAKIVAEAYFKHDAYKQVFPTVQAARQASATLDSLGGETGITEMQNEISDYRAEIQQFADGDPKLLNQLFGEKGEGGESFATMAANGLQLLAERDPKLLDQAMMPALVARLEAAKFPQTVSQVLKLIEAGKGQESYDLLKQIEKWMGEAKAYSDKQISLKTTKDPKAEALQRERQEFEKQKATDYENRVSSDVNGLNNSAMSKVIEPFFKDLKLKTEGRREFVNALQSRIWKEMDGDAAFKRAAKAIRATGDAKRHTQFIHDKFSELLPLQFRNLRNAMYPNYKPATRATGAGTGANGKPGGTGGTGAGTGAAAGAAAAVTSVAGKKPNREDVDWAKTHDTMWIAGQAVLKNGKTVKWNWKTV